MTPTPLQILAVISLLAHQVPAYSQTSSEGQVTASGTAEIKHPAELLRLQIELTGKGKDLKEALAKLKERKELAVAQLLNLGAPRTGVSFSEIDVVTERNDRQRQIEMMMMQRRGGVKKTDPKNKQPDPVLVSTTLKAELPLKASSPEELLQVGHTLQEKIKSADLSGSKETEKLSPKDEEVAEEMQEINRMMAEQGEGRKGEPIFLFVYKINATEHEKAMKEAFAKATTQATRLATAAGVELGALHSLQGNVSNSASSTPADYMQEFYSRMGRPAVQEGTMDSHDKDGGTEAVGISPIKVSLKLSVTVAYTIKQKK